MAKTRKISPSGLRPLVSRTRKNNAAATAGTRRKKGADPAAGRIPAGNPARAGNPTRAGNNSTAVTDMEDNGDCGNGKIRCKSLVVDGTRYRTRLNQKFETRKAWKNPDPKKVTSSIPGTILKVFVKEGQEVNKGDQMLILEAMKMKNKIMFHRSGTVKNVHVKEGEKVPKDHLMVELE
jgi:biotin carboxyl carrier protein